MSETPASHPADNTQPQPRRGVARWLARLLPGKTDTSLREAIEELMDEEKQGDNGNQPSIAAHERTLITNVLELRDMPVVDVMVPRADIVAIEISTPADELYRIIAEKPHTRFPVYRDNLDDVIGAIHSKDLFAKMVENKDFELNDITRPITFVSPAMKVLDLLLQMRQSHVHIAMVIDEFGGIDGLITINDLIEAIVGEIEDEHALEATPTMVERKDGTVIADARVLVEEFENRYGKFFTVGAKAQEFGDVDTLGGLLYEIVGRIPSRGEIIKHDSGMEFEIIEADPRKIIKLRIRHIPKANSKIHAQSQG